MTAAHDGRGIREKKQFADERLANAINDLDNTGGRGRIVTVLTSAPPRKSAAGSAAHRGRHPGQPASASQAVIHGGVGTLLLPQDELIVDSPVDLARLLARCMASAGLTAGQTAAKSGIPRSQTYYLIDPKRNSLPRKEAQVRAFLTACRLHCRQVDFVLIQWRRLDADRGRYKVATTLPAGRPSVPSPADAASGTQNRAAVTARSSSEIRLCSPEVPAISRRAPARSRLSKPEASATSRRDLAGSVVVVLLGGIALVVDPTAISSVITTAMATAIVVGKVLRLKERLGYALRVWVMQAAAPGGEHSPSR
ncbi:hypothetical protein Amsp01_002740 [Amycolatopsis sp. NBRC 101858]|uniref:hypothetical protein n=1 Tax=Amycolatopsis sp. NBRC 101858 TaxID=3032200 RepID=UPI0024A2B899|nr:hypothetical protein [Amycolatopsis sp. NBRC 101858]GLY34250.1 hypothetical protein Amsp01_002740 [Amycolatopsis sp. NBRC 101858]